MAEKIKIEPITQEEFDKVEARRPASRWNDIIGRVKDKKQVLRISGLTRGQVAAGYRRAKGAGIQVKASYPPNDKPTAGMLHLAPPLPPIKIEGAEPLKKAGGK